MSSDCEQTRLLLSELALGIADGEARARALAHIASCSECRRELEALTEVSDELLLLAPTHEPPAGFESRVLSRLELRHKERPWRRATGGWRRGLAVAGAVVAVAAVSVGATLIFAYRDDRDVADRYQATLAEANGSYFSAARLYDPSRSQVGVAFGYQGEPSWVFVVVRGREAQSDYVGELITVEGRRVPLRSFRLAGGTWGGTIPAEMHDVAALRLVERDGGEVLRAQFR